MCFVLSYKLQYNRMQKSLQYIGTNLYIYIYITFSACWRYDDPESERNVSLDQYWSCGRVNRRWMHRSCIPLFSSWRLMDSYAREKSTQALQIGRYIRII